MTVKESTDTIYAMYYTDVGKYKPLTAKEELQLFNRYYTCMYCNCEIANEVLRDNCPKCSTILVNINKEVRTQTCIECNTLFSTYEVPKYCRNCGSPRDTAARERLINANLRFVVKKAKKMSKDPNKIKTLISAGNVGLVLAVDKFDRTKGTRFLTYADWWIRKEMYDAINTSSLVYIPVSKRKVINKAIKEGQYTCKYCGYRTTDKNDVNNVTCIKDAHIFINTVENKNNALINGSVLLESFESTLEDKNSKCSIESKMVDVSIKHTLQQILRTIKLTPRDLYILLGYFNLAHPDRRVAPKSLMQLSEVLGVSPERIRQLKTIALNKIKNRLTEVSLEDLADIID